jgi:multimeric flavodoxin WrbA
MARADAWAFIWPTNWYGPTSNFKLLFDRLVCMNGGRCAQSAEEATAITHATLSLL